MGQGHDRIREDAFIPATTSMSTVAMAEDGIGERFDPTPRQKMIAAMSGSFLTSLLVTPLDVIRVRLQSQTVQSPLTTKLKLAALSPQSFRTLPPSLGITSCCREVFFASNGAEVCMAAPRIGDMAAGACAVEETQKKTFTSTLDGIRKIARNEGVTSLWRGLTPTLAMGVPSNIIYFTGYDWLRYNKSSPINSNFSENYSPLFAGAMARMIAASVVSPIEMFKTRLQASQSTGGAHFAETTKGLRDMVATHGYTSLWRGLTLSLWRDAPFSGIYWWGYETIRGALTDVRERRRGREIQADGSQKRSRSRSQSRENHTATFIDSFFAGAGSGSVAAILTVPFDVGKTRQQVFKESEPIAGVKRVLAPEERSMPRFLWHIFKTEGLSGLWRGWVPRTLKIAPACAIMISSYEVGKRAFRSLNEKAEEKQSTVY
ncbi:mitochondrial carrier domain-containing protein [Calycina marina]|uniref:Mitochondrial carrier domain-containing protein n=1 Tax=Calycina marina TaxID=1763456 RepID=A0A9P8CJR3_9HELO|nr:mitochondrial carrier domain-containing protein [Calycina marina]